MEPVFKSRGKLLTGLFVMMFSTAALAQDLMEPTWVKEGVDWSKYNKFLVKPLNIDDVQLVRPPWAVDDPKEWVLQVDDLEAVQAIYRDAINSELAGGDSSKLAYAPGPNVLEVEVEILSVTPWVRPGSDGTSGGMQVTTMGTGEMMASVELRDSKTRELLLLIAGDKAVGEEYKEFTRENNVANIDNMFTTFAKRLRNAMDRVHGK